MADQIIVVTNDISTISVTDQPATRINITGNTSTINMHLGGLQIEANGIPSITGPNAVITGPVIFDGNGIIQDNNRFTFIGDYSNANVAAFLPTYGGNIQVNRLDFDVATISNAIYFDVYEDTVFFSNVGTGDPSSIDVGELRATDFHSRGGIFGNQLAISNVAIINGNVTANYFLGNGRFLSGLPEVYSNANAANFLAVYTGNISAGNITVTNNVTVDFGNLELSGLDGNGYLLGNIAFAVGGYGNIDVFNYLPTYTGNLASLQANVETTANVRALFYEGNGRYLSGIQVNEYSNSNVANYLAVFGGNILAANISADWITATAAITTTGNITANYYLGNGRLLTGLYSNADVANYLRTYTGNLQAGNLLLTRDGVVQGNFTIQGTLTTVNSNTLVIQDKTITVANGAITQSEANGAGILVGPTVANLLYLYPSNCWTSSHDICAPNVRIDQLQYSNGQPYDVGGVRRITAQAGITVSPPSGVGNVTISASGAIPSPAITSYRFTGNVSAGVVTDELLNFAFSADFVPSSIISIDDQQWAAVTGAPALSAVHYNATDNVDTFVYALASNQSLYSTDSGNTWTTVTGTGMTGDSYATAYGEPSGNPVWVSVRTNGTIWYRAAATPTGAWTQATVNDPPTNLVFNCLWNTAANLFVAVGNQGIWTSPDGITWTRQLIAANLRGLYCDGTRWFTSLYNSGTSWLWYSSDLTATSWTQISTGLPSATNVHAIYNIGTTYIAAGTAIYRCTSDPTVASNWNQITQPTGFTGYCAGISGEGGVFRLITTGSQYFVSTDGSSGTWTEVTLPGTGIFGPRIVSSSSRSFLNRPAAGESISAPVELASTRYSVTLPAHDAYSQQTITWLPDANGTVEQNAVNLGSNIVAARPTYSASYANTRVAVVDTNSSGDITGVTALLQTGPAPTGSITLTVSDGANSSQDTVTFFDPRNSQTYQFSPAFNSSLSDVANTIVSSETLSDWTATIDSYSLTQSTVLLTADANGYVPQQSLVTCTVIPGTSAGVTGNLTVNADVVDLGGPAPGIGPGGSSGAMQYNLNGYFGGATGFNYSAVKQTPSIQQVLERATPTGVPMSGTINYNVLDQAILYYNIPATGNSTINFRGNATTTLDTVIDIGQSLTVTFINETGATAYLPTAYQIDGTDVTPRWVNGVTPGFASINSTMTYTFTVIKTAADVYRILASQTRFS